MTEIVKLSMRYCAQKTKCRNSGALPCSLYVFSRWMSQEAREEELPRHAECDLGRKLKCCATMRRLVVYRIIGIL